MREGVSGDLGDVLQHGFWNLKGYTSKLCGNKLISEDFLNEVADCDVIGLVETHVHSKTLDELCIPGYSRLHFLNREPHSNGNCGSGGLAVFCKEHISNFLTPIPGKNPDVIWVKIQKSLILYLSTVYFSPRGNREMISKIFENLSAEITYFERKGCVILQ